VVADEKIKEMTLASTTMTLSTQSHRQGQISLPAWFCRLHQIGSSGTKYDAVTVVVGTSSETHQVESGYEIKAKPETALFKKAKAGTRVTIEIMHPKPFK
jgi:hypothetical protein